MQHTPHAWPSHTLQNFPPVLVDMVSETTGPKENVAQLKKSVEEEWRLVLFFVNMGYIIAISKIGILIHILVQVMGHHEQRE